MLEETTRCYGILAQLCPQEEQQEAAFPNVSGGSTTSSSISTNSSAILFGMPAYEAVVDADVQPENRTKSLIVMTIQDNRLYSVAHARNESIFEQSLPIARDMISSFTIVKQKV